MKPKVADPFRHVPAEAAVWVHVWIGRRDRCEGKRSRTFGADHAAARAYFAEQICGDTVSRVQVVASWFENAESWPVRRMDCLPSGHMTVRQTNTAWQPKSRIADADTEYAGVVALDAAFVLDRAA